MGNPVLPEVKPLNRDPKVIWHEATKRWIMTFYAGYPWETKNARRADESMSLARVAFDGGEFRRGADPAAGGAGRAVCADQWPPVYALLGSGDGATVLREPARASDEHFVDHLLGSMPWMPRSV